MQKKISAAQSTDFPAEHDHFMSKCICPNCSLKGAVTVIYHQEISARALKFKLKVGDWEGGSHDHL